MGRSGACARRLGRMRARRRAGGWPCGEGSRETKPGEGSEAVGESGSESVGESGSERERERGKERGRGKGETNMGDESKSGGSCVRALSSRAAEGQTRRKAAQSEHNTALEAAGPSQPTARQRQGEAREATRDARPAGRAGARRSSALAFEGRQHDGERARRFGQSARAESSERASEQGCERRRRPSTALADPERSSRSRRRAPSSAPRDAMY